MSRFFATGSDSESDTSSKEEQIQRAPAAAFTYSDDEEDTKRVVRSAKEKRYGEIKNAIKLIGNQKKIKDINPMLNTFEDMTKAYSKAGPVISSVENGKTPTFYLRALVELDDFIKEVWKDTDGRKSMSKSNSKALSTLRQKLRKYIKEKDFEKEIEAFRENPPKDDDDDEEERVLHCLSLIITQRILERIPEMLTLLLSTNDIILTKSIPEDEEEYEKSPFKLHGCVLTLAERLDEEFIKLLKECDPHSNEYVERQGTPSELCRIYIRKIEHLYYKFDPIVLKQKDGEISADALTSVKVMDKMCKYIYSHDETDRLRTRAILSHIYHHSIHDNWFKARDLFLMSNLQENIHHSDPATQILYNRAVAHLGLCAFRHANIKDAHNCLLDLMMTGKVKELLAQGLMPQRQHERSKEQEKIEKQRQMPFHMHINLEVLECVYLVSAMLIEIPYMAGKYLIAKNISLGNIFLSYCISFSAHEFDARRRMISKTYYQQLRSSERQSLVGPPESMREHVVAASKAMRNGNWAVCNNFIINEKMNGKVWDLFYQADKVRAMLTKLIKEEALRTYLFTYSHVYDSISMPTLALMFELERATVHSIISKMIINEELMASLDEPSETVVMHRSEPSRLQSLALQLTDKVNNFVDSNERIFEMKQGNFRNQGNFRERFNRQDWGGRQRRERNRNNDERNNY
ncbi:unnamed protein product [Trichogramma brassicae]|uniref:Eukaryotic translation initiation factor 3 subunit C n=1 Tax=Trichogramma brassicae TaxID=86971 RepID=A0A6H5IQA4_9HYME|nr:unnamed protein product [Trichogramma brassicae]